MDLNLFLIGLSSLLGFSLSYIAVPYGRQYLRSSGIIGVDQQKSDKPELPSSGGLIVFFSFLTSFCFYLGIDSLLNVYAVEPSLMLAALSSISIITLIGLIDDININYNSDDEVRREGLSQFWKMIFVLPAAFPLIAVGAGSEVMIFPLIGRIEWGYIYPLILLPLGLLFVSNVVNMLEGMNGLGSSLTIVTSITLGVFGFVNGFLEASALMFILAACLTGFLVYNWYPASILPGDSLTYLCGGALFTALVIGDMEKFGVFVFSLWILEFVLKARSKFNASSWGSLNPDGSLSNRHNSVYSVTHLFMDQGYGERDIALIITGVQIVICLVGLILFL